MMKIIRDAICVPHLRIVSFDLSVRRLSLICSVRFLMNHQDNPDYSVYLDDLLDGMLPIDPHNPRSRGLAIVIQSCTDISFECVADHQSLFDWLARVTGGPNPEDNIPS